MTPSAPRGTPAIPLSPLLAAQSSSNGYSMNGYSGSRSLESSSKQISHQASPQASPAANFSVSRPTRPRSNSMQYPSKSILEPETTTSIIPRLTPLQYEQQRYNIKTLEQKAHRAAGRVINERPSDEMEEKIKITAGKALCGDGGNDVNTTKEAAISLAEHQKSILEPQVEMAQEILGMRKRSNSVTTRGYFEAKAQAKKEQTESTLARAVKNLLS